MHATDSYTDWLPGAVAKEKLRLFKIADTPPVYTSTERPLDGFVTYTRDSQRFVKLPFYLIGGCAVRIVIGPVTYWEPPMKAEIPKDELEEFAQRVAKLLKEHSEWEATFETDN